MCTFKFFLFVWDAYLPIPAGKVHTATVYTNNTLYTFVIDKIFFLGCTYITCYMYGTASYVYNALQDV